MNGAPLYQELLRCPDTDLVLVVSDVVHQAVVRHGYPGITPSGYTPVRVRNKEVDQQAWISRPIRTHAAAG